MRIVIVGTGTNVGKTHLGVALVGALRRAGRVVCGLKPVESGVPAGEIGPDARALAEAGVFHVKQPPPYALPEPVSPHLAARHAGCRIELAPILRWVDAHGGASTVEYSPAEQMGRRPAEWTAGSALEPASERPTEPMAGPFAECLVVETAGGLLSPLGPSLTNLDLAAALEPTCWILVGVDRLGVLHDVAACMLALRTLCSPAVIPLVVLQAPSEADASTGTNAEELLHLDIVPRVFEVPRGDPDSTRCQEAVASLLRALR
jgi:dethiobiotin synthetase